MILISGFEKGAFEEEMAPMSVTVDGKPVVVDKDDHPRANTTLESLSKLPVLFRKGGVGTVGNSTVSLEIGIQDLLRFIDFSCLAEISSTAAS